MTPAPAGIVLARNRIRKGLISEKERRSILGHAMQAVDAYQLTPSDLQDDGPIMLSLSAGTATVRLTQMSVGETDYRTNVFKAAERGLSKLDKLEGLASGEGSHDEPDTLPIRHSNRPLLDKSPKNALQSWKLTIVLVGDKHNERPVHAILKHDGELYVAKSVEDLKKRSARVLVAKVPAADVEEIKDLAIRVIQRFTFAKPRLASVDRKDGEQSRAMLRFMTDVAGGDHEYGCEMEETDVFSNAKFRADFCKVIDKLRPHLIVSAEMPE